MTVELNDEAVAYPYEMLRDERVVNDVVGTVPVVVLWAPGTASALDAGSVAGGDDVGAATTYARELDGDTLSFVVEGGRIVDERKNRMTRPPLVHPNEVIGRGCDRARHGRPWIESRERPEHRKAALLEPPARCQEIREVGENLAGLGRLSSSSGQSPFLDATDLVVDLLGNRHDLLG